MVSVPPSRVGLSIRKTPHHRRSEERGASLILALVFIVAISLIVIPLADWASSSLINTNNFQKVSTLDYALSSATNTAIEAIRHTPQPQTPSLNAQGYGVESVGDCWVPSSGNVSSLTINGYTINVWCQTTVNLSQSATRVVTLYACTSTQGGGSESSCQAAPQLEAQASFDDYPLSGGVTLINQCNIETGSCGFSQTLNQWIWATQAT